ncbi:MULTISPECIES: type II toxin-antitoxin system prevent-host-death family antitoxin [unclassified Sphingopyxis]|uniref:type II toxin-antitoxin system prevent-host-death family antitoxin n=1 Tax=unclassified Sphingopyxis TaxID=2614943 RepID=UPI0009EADE85|nr:MULTISPECIES: type II toxin-antitoxin system prevent-host-death family antitoxin [unclassified Sphingopyxis]
MVARKIARGAPGVRMRSWKLEDAKARFSEVVRLAESEGPQRVTVRGREAVVVMSVAELNRLLPDNPEQLSLVPFLEGLHLDGLNLEREIDRGRDFAL